MDQRGIARQIYRLANGTVNGGILAAILLLLTFGAYAMWDCAQVYSQADSGHYVTYNPTTVGKESFANLQQINPEVFAWLTVYGTNIDYPVVQSRDGRKDYLNTDAKGNYSLSGAIYLDPHAPADFSSFTSVIYGHHMEKKTMFGEIGLFAGESFFDGHRYGRLYYSGQEHGLEFFAFLRANAYDQSVYRRDVTAGIAPDYLDHLLSLAALTRPGVTVGPGDHIVMLSTCSDSSTNGRDILIAKISSKVFADPFPPNTRLSGTLAISHLPGLWGQSPPWVRACLISLPGCLVLVILAITRQRRRARSVPQRGYDTLEG